MVFNENIERVDILGSDENETRLEIIRKRLDSMFETERESIAVSGSSGKEDIIETRDKLVEWFRKNRLDVKLENEQSSRLLDQEDRIVLNIMDSVYIHPPYRAENCVSTNEIVLNRVRNLINSCV